MLLAAVRRRAAAGWPPRLRTLTFDARISSRKREGKSQLHQACHVLAAGPRVAAGSHIFQDPRFEVEISKPSRLRRYSTAVEDANGLYEDVFVPTRSNGGVTLGYVDQMSHDRCPCGEMLIDGNKVYIILMR